MKNLDAILLQLKKAGPTTSSELAEQLSMTNMGARGHLLKLAEQGLVNHFMQKAQVGRPKKYWVLTEQGHSKFPDKHADITVHLIDSVTDLFGEEGLNALIAQREKKISHQYQSSFANCISLRDKVTALTELRNQEGYMAEFKEHSPEHFTFIENHCPICVAAKKCQQFCRSELAIFRECFGSDVSIERQEHLLDQSRRCTYEIKVC